MAKRQRVHKAARDFAEKAERVAKARGGATVIEREVDVQEWRAWRGYFDRIGMKWSARQMRGADEWTVPTRLPDEFEAAW